MSIVKSILVSVLILIVFYGIGWASQNPYHYLNGDDLSVAEMRHFLPPTNYYINKGLEDFSPDIKTTLREHTAEKVFLVWADITETFSSKEWQDRIRAELGLKAKEEITIGQLRIGSEGKVLYCIY